jgi:hypothetical protein
VRSCRIGAHRRASQTKNFVVRSITIAEQHWFIKNSRAAPDANTAPPERGSCGTGVRSRNADETFGTVTGLPADRIEPVAPRIAVATNADAHEQRICYEYRFRFAVGAHPRQ